MAQVRTLCSEWAWSPEDRIVHPLPLHHIHGLVNALLCAHAAGAAVQFQPRFAPASVWDALVGAGADTPQGPHIPPRYYYFSIIRLVQNKDSLVSTL